ncbi:MAG: hypothetical protein GXO93_04305, partial [FCB group bacterium]|nr:hypothetical protein [FCB group bacterium]
MPKHFLKYLMFLTLLISNAVYSQKSEKLILIHSQQFEVVRENDRYITYVVGDVTFKTKTGYIYCDSARWIKGENVHLNGHVKIDDAKYRINADSIFYNVSSENVLAMGKRVELWSFDDSLYAIGSHAYYDKLNKYFIMKNRPVMYINYPDSSRMIEVIANTIEYNTGNKNAQATGEVKISSKEFSAYAECAQMNTEEDLLDLFDNPSVQKGKSKISGSLISVFFNKHAIRKIDVIDSANAEFNEPVDSTATTTYYDKSILSGRRIVLNFKKNHLDTVLCYGQAYSWYYPSSRGREETKENAVSGDTIRFLVNNEQLRKIYVIGGAEGRYLSGKYKVVDSNVVKVVDTIDYRGEVINYNIKDSLITLNKAAHVTSGVVALSAEEIKFDTKRDIIEAFSAAVKKDTVPQKYSFAAQIQPNTIPV